MENSPLETTAWAEYELGMALFAGISSGSANDAEHAIVALKNARNYFTPETHPERWAEITMNLGLIYLTRRKHNDSSHLRESIDYMRKASSQYKNVGNYLMFAKCESHLGAAYLKLGFGDYLTTKEDALRHFDAALTVITKENWPEVWHKIHLDLHMMYQGLGDLGLADEHAKLAFGIDRSKHDELYESMIQLLALHNKQVELRRELRQLGGGPVGT